MKRAIFTLLCSSAIVVGCSNPITNNTPDMTAPQEDMSVGMDLTINPDFAGVTCGNMTCAAPNVCCVTQTGQGVSAACSTMAACNSGNILACDGPEDCSSGSSNCCVQIDFSGFDASAMTGGSGGASCNGSCAFGADIGTRTGQSKLCHTDNDCAGYQGQPPFGNPDRCCSTPSAQGVHFCGFPLNFGGITITCP